jgi:hypothetical protein
LTAAKKAEYWRPAIEDVLEMLLIIDRQQLGGSVTPYRPTVEIQDSVQGDLAQLAASVELINRAQAASLDTKIRMLHPDWEQDQVAAEVQRITEEQGLSVPDPIQTGIV